MSWHQTSSLCIMSQLVRADLMMRPSFNIKHLLKIICYTTDAHTSPHKTPQTWIKDLIYAYDFAFVAKSEKVSQHITYCFIELAQLYGLYASKKKTEVQCQSAPQEDYHTSDISLVNKPQVS